MMRYGHNPNRRVGCPGAGKPPKGKPWFEGDGLRGFCTGTNCGGVYRLRNDGNITLHRCRAL